jgi:uncharacterized coiled-coil protein SlyX
MVFRPGSIAIGQPLAVCPFEQTVACHYDGVLEELGNLVELEGQTMADDRDQLEALISSLKQQRDELAVQIHLGKAEAQEEWDKLTAKLDELTKDYEPLKDAVAETAGNMFSALKLVAGEVQDGFERIRKAL